MRRYPASTIPIYMDLPSTQKIKTYISHRYNTTPPLHTLVQAPTHSPHTSPTPPQHKHRHTSITPPVLTWLVKSKPNPLIYSPPLHPRRPAPSQTHTHITHFTNSSYPLLVSCARHNIWTTCTTYMSCTHHTTPHSSPHHHCRHPRTLTLYQHTHMQHKQQHTHHSCSNHRINIRYHDNLTYIPKTTTWLHTHHKDTNTKHIIIANIYIPPRDSTSTHYRAADMDLQHWIQYITNIPHSPEMWTHTPLSGTRTLMTTADN